jgi:hypothetical protein
MPWPQPDVSFYILDELKFWSEELDGHSGSPTQCEAVNLNYEINVSRVPSPAMFHSSVWQKLAHGLEDIILSAFRSNK